MVLLKKPSQKEHQQQLKMWQPLSNPIRGDLKAPVTLIEFTDYKCPFCKKLLKNTLLKLNKQYIDTSKLRLVVLNFLLPFHKNARPAENTAHCTSEKRDFGKDITRGCYMQLCSLSGLLVSF